MSVFSQRDCDISLLLPMPLPWLVRRIWPGVPNTARFRVIQLGTPALGAATLFFGRFQVLRLWLRAPAH